MRILAVGNMYPPQHLGGYELVWRSAMRHLRAAGHELRVLTTDLRLGRDEPDDPGTHRELRWYWREGGYPGVGYRERVRLERHNHAVLRRHLAALRPDVVTWWSMGGMSLSLIEHVNRRGLPAVAFVHDDWLDYGRHVDAWLAPFGALPRLAPLAERAFGVPARVDFGRVRLWLFVSEATRARAMSLGLELGETGVAHSGVDPAFLDAPPPRPEWGGHLLYVGRIDERKGIDTAVEALASSPGATLTVAGGGDERERARLDALAAARGVAPRVRFAGHLDAAGLRERYAAADAVVFPVRWEEPWGLVPLEAMAQGRPVVATGRGGSAEYLRDGENCLLFGAGDPAALAACVGRLAVDRGLRDRLVAGGRQTAAAHTADRFDRQVMEAVLAVAQPLPDGTPGGSPPGGPKYSTTRAGTPTATQ